MNLWNGPTNPTTNGKRYHMPTYIKITDAKVAKTTEEFKGRVFFDWSNCKELVGIEILCEGIEIINGWYKKPKVGDPSPPRPVIQDTRDVHTEHCCRIHGCKYADDTCPVWLGYKTQSFACETCHPSVFDDHYHTVNIKDVPKIHQKEFKRRREEALDSTVRLRS